MAVLVLLLAEAMLVLDGAVKNALREERVAAAQTVVGGFHKGLDETFKNLNAALKLSYAIDLDDSDHLELFQKSARRLTEENEHVAYVCLLYTSRCV